MKYALGDVTRKRLDLCRFLTPQSVGNHIVHRSAKFCQNPEKFISSASMLATYLSTEANMLAHANMLITATCRANQNSSVLNVSGRYSRDPLFEIRVSLGCDLHVKFVIIHQVRQRCCFTATGDVPHSDVFTVICLLLSIIIFPFRGLFMFILNIWLRTWLTTSGGARIKDTWTK